jgi:serine/threonine-protein kinase RsbW
LDFRRHTSCLATTDHLADLLGFMEQACQEAGLDEEVSFTVRLAAEEACCNVIGHAYAGLEPGPLSLELRVQDDHVTVVVEDRAPVFRPEDAPAPDLSSDWENKRLGGLGWHLIQQLMDEVRHEPAAGGGNRLTLVKRRAAQTAEAESH